MQSVITAFEQFAGQNGQYYGEFYIGIAANPIDRLTNGHGVDNSVPHIYWNAPLSRSIVSAIEKYFLDKGAKGSGGGGDVNTRYVYMYKIAPQTRE